MIIGRTPDKLFAHIAPQLTGDYVVLSRYGDDDYIRPADMRTNCQTLNTPATQPDDLSEPNRFEHHNAELAPQGWKLEDGGYVRTTYNCYPTAQDFTASAKLIVQNIPDSTQTPTPPYLIDGIAFTYGCCFGIGLGYARWNPNHYRKVVFAFSPNDLQVQPYSGTEYWATIYRENGILNLGDLIEYGTYTIPEKMAVKRVSIEVKA